MGKKKENKGKIKWGKILVSAIVAVLGFSFILFFNPQLIWKKVSVGDLYTLQIPLTWNYIVNKDKEEIVVSDYLGELSIQDRASVKETASLSVVKINILDKKIDALSFVNENITPSYKEGEVEVIKTSLDGFPVVRVIVGTGNIEYWHVEKGDKLYVIFVALYEYSPKNKEILDKILDSIHFSQ